MDVALSRSGAWILRVFFAVVVVFLYAPIVILLIFSFNDASLPTFPLSGFTLHWYHEFLTNSELKGSLRTSAIASPRTASSEGTRCRKAVAGLPTVIPCAIAARHPWHPLGATTPVCYPARSVTQLAQKAI